MINRCHGLKHGGFMLVEALLCVAILALLVAVAVPRYNQAELRAKTSKARSDIHSIVIALENYAADHAHYPLHGFTDQWHFNTQQAVTKQVLGSCITTPVAYLTSLDITRDAFVGNIPQGSYDEETQWTRTRYNYVCFQEPWSDFNPAGRQFAQQQYGLWRLAAAGPDQKFFLDLAGNFSVRSYDPTNGTRSSGDILWLEKSANVIRP